MSRSTIYRLLVQIYIKHPCCAREEKNVTHESFIWHYLLPYPVFQVILLYPRVCTLQIDRTRERDRENLAFGKSNKEKGAERIWKHEKINVRIFFSFLLFTFFYVFKRFLCGNKIETVRINKIRKGTSINYQKHLHIDGI